jgi:O-antigen/teichoic acid export membrane protein
MTAGRKILKGAALLTAGRIASFALSFIRNLILARVLAKADYGLAAAFAMMVSLLEVAGRISLNQQMIQSKDGNSERFQYTAHTVQFLAGLFSVILLACLCVPMARGFGVPEAAWAFAWLASVPFCKGLEHLDNVRQQREMNYRPTLLADLIPQLIAERAYRWCWDSILARKMLLFGWPLLLNGLLIFGCQQADQLIVASVFSLQELANYALAFSLVSIPWFVFAQVASSIMLPLLSKSQDDIGRFRYQYQICLEYAALAALVMLLPLVLTGEQIVTFFYGSKYSGLGGIVALLGAASALRFLRVAPGVAAIAKGDPLNQLYSNLWRSVSLPLALIAAGFGGGIHTIASCALVGEVVASVASVRLLLTRRAIPLKFSIGAYGYLAGFLGVSGFIVGSGLLKTSLWLAVAVTIGVISLGIYIGHAIFPEAAKLLIKALKRDKKNSAIS